MLWSVADGQWPAPASQSKVRLEEVSRLITSMSVLCRTSLDCSHGETVLRDAPSLVHSSHAPSLYLLDVPVHQHHLHLHMAGCSNSDCSCYRSMCKKSLAAERWPRCLEPVMAEVSNNHRVLLKHYVRKGPLSEDDFQVVKETKPASLEVSSSSRDVLIKTLYLSCDPYVLERMTGMPCYPAPFKLGQPIEGSMVGKVVQSAHPDFKEGDLVTGMGKWEEYFVAEDARDIQKTPPMPIEGFPPSYFMGVLGISGLTAWHGFFEVAQPKPGDAVFVSTAAGAVGQLVGQFAKHIGCYVVGSAGSQEKVKLLKEVLKFDNAFNYKEELDLEATLVRLFPKGIDIYFENVGGKTLDAVLSVMNNYGRIAVCGMISQYNYSDPSKADPLRNSVQILKKRLTMQGFIVGDHMQDKKLASKFYNTVGSLLQQKKIVYKEDVVEGLERAPSALVKVYEGRNVGKMVVKVSDP